jgi:hypothetical protein
MSCRGIVLLRRGSSSAQGDDNRHTRREEQRASGIAKLVKSNLRKPGLSKYRVVHLMDEIALAEIGSGIGAEYPRTARKIYEMVLHTNHAVAAIASLFRAVSHKAT